MQISYFLIEQMPWLRHVDFHKKMHKGCWIFEYFTLITILSSEPSSNTRTLIPSSCILALSTIFTRILNHTFIDIYQNNGKNTLKMLYASTAEVAAFLFRFWKFYVKAARLLVCYCTFCRKKMTSFNITELLSGKKRILRYQYGPLVLIPSSQCFPL